MAKSNVLFIDFGDLSKIEPKISKIKEKNRNYYVPIIAIDYFRIIEFEREINPFYRLRYNLSKIEPTFSKVNFEKSKKRFQ